VSKLYTMLTGRMLLKLSHKLRSRRWPRPEHYAIFTKLSFVVVVASNSFTAFVCHALCFVLVTFNARFKVLWNFNNLHSDHQYKKQFQNFYTIPIVVNIKSSDMSKKIFYFIASVLHNTLHNNSKLFRYPWHVPKWVPVFHYKVLTQYVL